MVGMAGPLCAQNSYFQQQVNYHIKVSLDTLTHTLQGFETIQYVNHSSDYLDKIMIHLWPNAYRDHTTPLSRQLVENREVKLHFAKPADRGYIDGLDFTVNHKPVRWEYENSSQEIAVLYLEHPLAPNDSILIATPFLVKIPLGVFSRMGHMNRSYQITQWYPKPAVYDRYGWHAMPYLDQGEFYSEYGSYTVEITLPDNYVVAATGELQNQDERARLLQRAAVTARRHTFSETDSIFSKPPTGMKTLTYKADSVHDFAWFAAPNYYVLHGEVILPHSQRTVDLWAYFTPEYAVYWKNSIEYLHDAVYYYSLWNGDYPYSQVSAADGALSAGGGMEYPMVTVIGAVSSHFMLEKVIMHEVGHNWFYGILGSNERKHPWMDEGINSFNELRYVETKYPQATMFSTRSPTRLAKIWELDHPHRFQYMLMYLYSASRNQDQPITLSSELYEEFNYATIVYSKTAMAFYFLKYYLGDSLFDRCMQEYYRRWKFKHPYPEDIQAVFEEITQQDLKWFFHDYLRSDAKVDIKLKRVSRTDSGYVVVIKNKSDLKMPVPFTAFGNNSYSVIHWTPPITGKYKYFVSDTAAINKIHLDYDEAMPQMKRTNDFSRTSGIFRKFTLPKINLLTGIPYHHYSSFYYFPLLGYNFNDGFMPGILIHNVQFLPKTIEWMLAPMWTNKNHAISGLAGARVQFFPSAPLIRNIQIELTGRTFQYGNPAFFGRYYKISPAVNIHFKPRRLRSGFYSSLQIREISAISEQRSQGDNISRTYANYGEVSMIYGKRHAISPYYLKVNIQGKEDFLKSRVEANFFFRYNEKSQYGLYVRFFVGVFLFNRSGNPVYNFQFSSNPDYTFDEIYMARNNYHDVWSQQIAPVDAMFRTYCTAPTANQWMNALNVATTLPLTFLQIYGNAGLSGYEKINAYGEVENAVSDPAWEVGVALRLVPDIIEIYFPVAQSSLLNQLTYLNRVRFMIRLQKFNLFKLSGFDLSRIING